MPLQTAVLSRMKEAMSVNILLVDDSPRIRAYVRSSIEQNTDWTVCEAENGEIALTMVLSLKPHFVVLDLSMPGMNGLETARRISVISPGLPMIMFTMHDSHLLLKEALAVGITHVFSKESGFGDNVLTTMRVCSRITELPHPSFGLEHIQPRQRSLQVHPLLVMVAVSL